MRIICSTDAFCLQDTIAEDKVCFNAQSHASRGQGWRYWRLGRIGMPMTLCSSSTLPGRIDASHACAPPVKTSFLSCTEQCHIHHFSDEAIYLGGLVSKARRDVRKDVQTKLSSCFAVLNGLSAFWYTSRCPKKFKVQDLVRDAVIRAKLVYGLEGAGYLRPL